MMVNAGYMPSSYSPSVHKLTLSETEKLYMKVQKEIAKNPLDFRKAIYTVLTALTSDNGLGYNRAICWFKNGNPNYLKGIVGKGPVKLKDIKKVWEGKLTLEDEIRMCEEVIDSDPLNEIIRGSAIYVPEYLARRPKDHDIHFIDKGYFKELFQRFNLDSNGARGVIQLIPEELAGVVTIENFPPYAPEVDHEELRLVASFTNLIQVAYFANKYIREGLAHNIKNTSVGTGGLAHRNLRNLLKIYNLLESPLNKGKIKIIESLLGDSIRQEGVVISLSEREEIWVDSLPSLDKETDYQLSFPFLYPQEHLPEKKANLHNPNQLKLF